MDKKYINKQSMKLLAKLLSCEYDFNFEINKIFNGVVCSINENTIDFGKTGFYQLQVVSFCNGIKSTYEHYKSKSLTGLYRLIHKCADEIQEKHNRCAGNKSPINIKSVFKAFENSELHKHTDGFDGLGHTLNQK